MEIIKSYFHINRLKTNVNYQLQIFQICHLIFSVEEFMMLNVDELSKFMDKLEVIRKMMIESSNK